jgi:hypothetical protein
VSVNLPVSHYYDLCICGHEKRVHEMTWVTTGPTIHLAGIGFCVECWGCHRFRSAEAIRAAGEAE